MGLIQISHAHKGNAKGVGEWHQPHSLAILREIIIETSIFSHWINNLLVFFFIFFIELEIPFVESHVRSDINFNRNKLNFLLWKKIKQMIHMDILLSMSCLCRSAVSISRSSLRIQNEYAYMVYRRCVRACVLVRAPHLVEPRIYLCLIRDQNHQNVFSIKERSLFVKVRFMRISVPNKTFIAARRSHRW